MLAMDICYPIPNNNNNNLSGNSRISSPVAISDRVKKKEPMMEKRSSSTPAGGSSDKGAADTSSGEPVTLNEILRLYRASITRNFRPDTMIEKGSLGRVIKAFLDGKTYAPPTVGNGIAVAVKKLIPGSGKGFEEWQAEVKLLGKSSHPNLVKLVGYCGEDRELLVYKFMQNPGIDYHVFKKGTVPLTWSARINIAIGVAQGLAFLHTTEKSVIYRDLKPANVLLNKDINAKLSDFGLAKLDYVNSYSRVSTSVVGTYGYAAPDYIATESADSLAWSTRIKIATRAAQALSFLHTTTTENRIIHRDVKSSNILLDMKFNAKLSDFGISKLGPENGDSCFSTGVKGTYGYVTPEYITTGRNLYVESDVYSFGVVLLEVMTGLRVHDRPGLQHNLVDWARLSTAAGGSSDSGTTVNFSGEHVTPSEKIVTPNLKSFTFPKLRNKPDTMIGEGGFGRVFKGRVDGVGITDPDDSAQGLKNGPRLLDYQVVAYYLNFSNQNWMKMTLLSFIGLNLLAAPKCMATDHKNIFQVVPQDVKNVWNGWVLRGLILISLISQISLSLLGYVRRYNWRTSVRMGLWCTCVLAYSVVPAALGMITQTNSEPVSPVGQPRRLNTSELMSFWAPFLFLHLGGPDSITAFASEDSKVYLRYLVEMVFLSVVALYILLLSWPGYSYLPQLSILVYLAGFVKCFERIQALQLADTGYLGNSMLSPNYQKSQGSTVNLDEVAEPLFPTDYKGPGKLISDAYDLFQTFKRLFEDLTLTLKDRDGIQSYFCHLKSHEAFHIVEIELGFAFDMLYTKANVVYTFMGLMLRLTSFFSLLMVPVCFYILYDMDYYPSIDIGITHLLVGLAIFMEIFSFIIMLRSDWTDHWLSQRNLTRNILVFPFLKQPTKQRWSGSIGQFNLLSVAIEEKPATCLRIQKFFRIDFICVKNRYKTYSKVSDNLKDLIYHHFLDLMVSISPPKELCSHKGSFSLRKNECDALLWSITKVEFDQSILIWHIATSLCFFSEADNQDDGADIDVCRAESKHISDYLLYLLVSYPVMLPIGIGMIRYRDTCAEATRFFNEKGLITEMVEACKKLLQMEEAIPCNKVKGAQSKSALFDGRRLALALKEMGGKHMWKVISQVWMEILAYAATHCRGIHHKQHLGKGGEFLTHVWLLMAHLGITEQFQEFQGHSRAKIYV